MSPSPSTFNDPAIAAAEAALAAAQAALERAKAAAESIRDPDQSRWLRAEEAAAILGISARQVYRWCLATNWPPAVRVGRSVRVDEAALRAWMEEQRAGTHRIVAFRAVASRTRR